MKFSQEETFASFAKQPRIRKIKFSREIWFSVIQKIGFSQKKMFFDSRN